MSARSLALAAGAIVAMLPTPVAADECSDYRAAFMLHYSAIRTHAVAPAPGLSTALIGIHTARTVH